MRNNWTKATTDPNVAIVSLLACLSYGYNAWLEVQKNGEQAHPIRIINPELDDWRNWEASFGVQKDAKALENHKYLNDTERDLMHNFTQLFGTQEAVDHYYTTGELTLENLNVAGVAHAVRIEDANAIRKDYDYGSYWMYHWRPKKGIPVWVVDHSVGQVIVVCHDTEEVNQKVALERAGKFLLALTSSGLLKGGDANG